MLLQHFTLFWFKFWILRHTDACCHQKHVRCPLYLLILHLASQLQHVFTIWKQCRTITLQGVRRTLEEDLKLQKKALDAYKSFISTELDNVSLKFGLRVQRCTHVLVQMHVDDWTKKSNSLCFINFLCDRFFKNLQMGQRKLVKLNLIRILARRQAKTLRELVKTLILLK